MPIPAKSRNAHVPSRSDEDSEWIIVAPKGDADVVEHILQRAPGEGIRRFRVLWSDRGPIKFYSSAEELWRDAFAN